MAVRLVFEGPDVARIIEHSLANPEYTTWDPAADDLTRITVDGAALMVVKDQGIYLMSGSDNSLRVNPDDPKDTQNVVVYANGFEPVDGPDGECWYEKCRAAVGGDDFGEKFEINEDWRGGKKVIINFGPRSFTAKVTT